MEGAGQWISALEGNRAAPVRILFARLGVVAACRPLSPGELAECLDMGGQRGAQYALYLSCDSLREAGARQAREGAALSPLDITEALAYSDVLAAAGIIARISGAGPALVRQLEEGEDALTAIADSSAAIADSSAAIADGTLTDGGAALADRAGGVFASAAGDNPFAPGAAAEAGGVPAGDNPFAPGAAVEGDGVPEGDNPFAPAASATPAAADGMDTAAEAHPADETVAADAGLMEHSGSVAYGGGMEPPDAAPDPLYHIQQAPWGGPEGVEPRSAEPQGGAWPGAMMGQTQIGPLGGMGGSALLTVGVPDRASRAALPHPATPGEQRGGDVGDGRWADALARVLADRLRDAAGNM